MTKNQANEGRPKLAKWNTKRTTNIRTAPRDFKINIDG